MIIELVRLAYTITLINMLIDRKSVRKQDIIKMILCIAGVVVVSTFVLFHFDIRDFFKLYPFLVNIPIFIAFQFISKYKGVKLLFVLLTNIVLCTPPIFIGQIVPLFFDGNTTVGALACMASYIPMLFIVHKYFRPLFLFRLRNSPKGWWTFCLIPFSFYALLYVQTIFNYDTQFGLYLYISIMASVLVFSAYVIILRSFKQTWDHLVMQNEQNILSMQVTAMQARSESIKQAEEKAVVYCHDLRHHLHLINGYLADNAILEAQKYIAKIEKTIEQTVPKKYCKNNAVNSILSYYINMAENKNITVESQINIPEQCSIADMDLCIILSNATENAINACVEIEDINNRRINISCKSKNEKLFIQVENSFTGEARFVEDMPVTEMKNHGLGTKSIASTVQKYGGIYSFSAKNGIFKMNAIL